MNTQQVANYERIRDAIEYLISNYRLQPQLEDVASHVNMSTYHFQRMFTEWAGVSPKQFLQYVSIVRAKELLKKSVSLFDTADDIGLSGTSRLHDLFIKIEGMTPGEYKNGGQGLSINYTFSESPFGEILVASTEKGICYIAFADNQTEALNALKGLFPNSKYSDCMNTNIRSAVSIFTQDWSRIDEIKLHVKGTPFQLKVWEALLKIPMGKLVTYGDVARSIDNPDANRAVGSAIGSNPIAFLIPCHRVIQSTGLFGQYHWGAIRKTIIIGWEGAKRNK